MLKKFKENVFVVEKPRSSCPSISGKVGKVVITKVLRSQWRVHVLNMEYRKVSSMTFWRRKICIFINCSYCKISHKVTTRIEMCKNIFDITGKRKCIVLYSFLRKQMSMWRNRVLDSGREKAGEVCKSMNKICNEQFNRTHGLAENMR
jgi:hypothetical protein